MFHFLTETTGTTAAMGGGSSLLMIAVMLVAFYFLLIRPENKRKKEAEQLRSSIAVTDEVTTIGGITGVVVEVKEDKFVIETGADRVRIEFYKWALSSNDTATKRSEAAIKAEQEAKAKAKAEKRAKKNKDM